MMFAVTPNCKPYLFRFCLLDIIPIILKKEEESKTEEESKFLTHCKLKYF